AGYRSQSGEHDRFQDPGNVMLDLARSLPDEQDVNSVVNSDCEDEAEGENVEQVERDMGQFHGRDHGADRERQGDDLNEPESPVAIKNGEERGIKESHQSADQDQLTMR